MMLITRTKTEKVPDNRGLHRYFPGKQVKYGILNVKRKMKNCRCVILLFLWCCYSCALEPRIAIPTELRTELKKNIITTEIISI